VEQILCELWAKPSLRWRRTRIVPGLSSVFVGVYLWLNWCLQAVHGPRVEFAEHLFAMLVSNRACYWLSMFTA
jgi:hypothetical protein